MRTRSTRTFAAAALLAAIERAEETEAAAVTGSLGY